MTQTETYDVDVLAAEIDARIHALPSRYTRYVRTLRREYSKHLKNAPPEVMVQLGLRLLDQHRFVAYELVCHHRAALSHLREKELMQFGRDMDSWDDVDAFALYLSGPIWRERQVPDRVIYKWARSKDRWWRRAALVSTVPLNSKARGGSGDTSRTLAVCEWLVDDHDDMVEKAMSWALRELSKRDATAVRRFLAEHDAVLAARVKREVKNKLSTGLKNPRHKSGH